MDNMSPSFNRFILKFTILLIACTGIVYYFEKEYHFTSLLDPAEVSTPKIVETPRALRPRSVLDHIIESNSSNVSLERTIVIFKNGSSVFISEPSENHIREATEKLQQLANYEIKFSVFKIDDGSYIVSFGDLGVTQWVFSNEVHAIQKTPLSQLRKYLTETENKKVPQVWNPTIQGRVGLVARAWLQTDIQQPEVHKILKGAIKE